MNIQGDNLAGTAGAVPFWKTDGVAIANIYEWEQYPLNSSLVGKTVSLIFSADQDSLVYSKDGENWLPVGTGGGGGGWNNPQVWYSYINDPSEVVGASDGSYAVLSEGQYLGGDIYQKINGTWQNIDPDGNSVFQSTVVNLSSPLTQILALDSLLDYYGSPTEVNPTWNAIFNAAITANRSAAFYYTGGDELAFWIQANPSDTAAVVAAFAPGFSIAGVIGGQTWNGTVTTAFASNFNINGNPTAGFVLQCRLFDNVSKNLVLQVLTQTSGTVWGLQGNITPIIPTGLYTNQNVSNRVLVKNPENTRWIAGPDVTTLARVYRQDLVGNNTPNQVFTITHNLGNPAVITQLTNITDGIILDVLDTAFFQIINVTTNSFELRIVDPLPPTTAYRLTVTG